jgi:hypothetical protein
MPPEAEVAAVKEMILRSVLGKNCAEPTLQEELKRKLFASPFLGAYRRAGWVLAIEGTPPRGTLVVYEDGCKEGEAINFEGFLLVEGKSRRLPWHGENATLISSFVAKHLCSLPSDSPPVCLG